MANETLLSKFYAIKKPHRININKTPLITTAYLSVVVSEFLNGNSRVMDTK